LFNPSYPPSYPNPDCFAYLDVFLNFILISPSTLSLYFIYMVIKTSSSASSTDFSSSKSKLSASATKLTSMNSVIDQIKQADKRLDTILSKQALALKLERQSGIKKTQMVYGLAALLGIFVLYRFATTFVISVVLMAYPLMLSLEAVEGHDKTKDAHILSYWSILAIIQLTEAVFPFVRRVVPFYNLLKLALAVYLYLPQTKV
jgi:hypothetical protein